MSLINSNSSEKTNYITTSVAGGLGNQLYEIAAVYAFGWENNLEPIIEKIDKSDSALNRSRPVYWNTVFKKVKTVDKKEIDELK